MVRDVAGTCHNLVAVVHGLGNDHRHQTVGVGYLLRIAWLQWCQRRQELALTVDEAKHVGDIAVWQLLVESLLARLLVLPLGLAPGQSLRVLVVFQVRQLALFQLAIERHPLRTQLGRQCIELGTDRLPQEGDVHLREHGGFLVHRNQLVGQMPVLQAVVNVELARLEAFPDLTVKPEFVTIGMQACRRAFGIEHQQVRTQAFRQRCRRTFVEWPL